MARQRIKTTRIDIIRYATSLFLERGYTASSTKQIAEALDIGTGNLTYYFPTKEHLLAVLVDMLCRFQWKMMKQEVDDGISSVMAICLELTAMAAMCETDEAARDFYISAYTSPMCLEIIRKNDTARAKEVFRDFCPGWTDEHFAEAELLVSGLEYATLMTVGDPVSLENRIGGALNSILQIYNIPPEIRSMKISRVLRMDYRAIARRMLGEFKEFVERTNEQALEALHQNRND
jgi:AcrR family transcriptional regulator